MQPPSPIEWTTALRQRLRAILSWPQLRILFIACTLIATLLTIVSIGETDQLARHFAVSWFISHCIGFSIYLLGATCIFGKDWPPLMRRLGQIALIVLGGWIGLGIALTILFLLFSVNTSSQQLYDTFITSTLLALFFGVVVWFYYALYERIEHMAAELAEKELAEERLLQLKTRAELDALRAKVQPHFLFNTLNSIASLIAINPAKAEEMVERLSELFRYALDAEQKHISSLQQELNVVRDYLEIEKVRLGERLDYRIEVTADLGEVEVPSLLLQPLVENSIRHGIGPLSAGGRIEIRCRCERDRVLIEIRDSGKGFDPLATSEGFGLRGVRERLQLHYGERHQFTIEQDNGTRIHILLPLEKEHLL
jgi:two-component system, LytTR family, sensor kinase